MKKLLKRVLISIIGVIAVLAITLYVVIAVRASHADKAIIHKEALSIIRVDVDKIAKDVLINSLFNPSYYDIWTDTTEENKRDKLKWWNTGFSIPSSLYLFTTVEDQQVYYAVLPVSDNKKFQSFVQDVLGTELEVLNAPENTWRIHSADNRLQLIANHTKAILSIGLSKEERGKQLSDYLNSDEENFIAIRNIADRSVSDLKGDMVFVDIKSNSQLQISFTNGKVDFHGNFPDQLLRLSNTYQARNLGKDNVLSLWINADIRSILENQRAFFDKENIPLDTILPYMGNYLDLEWKKGSVRQTDTIISYDYDDNFEMVTKKEVREVEVPDLLFTVKASPHLKSYLPEKLFYKFNKGVSGDLIQLSTDKQLMQNMEMQPVDYPLYLKFKNDAEAVLVSDYIPFVQRIKLVEIRGKKEENLSIDGNIEMVNSSIHGLYQLFE